MKSIILASQSKVRLKILLENGFKALPIPANIDEESVKASLLDETSERKTQVWEKHMTQHKLYTSSVRAIETILHKVKLLRTSQSCQEHFNACLCINSWACLSLSMCVHVSVLALPLLGRCDSLVCVFVSRLKFV